MELTRAHLLVTAMNSFFFADLELGIRPAPDYATMDGVSLLEMATAAQMVRDENDRTREAPAGQDGTRSFSMQPDDRLIAAIYALLNYGPRKSDVEPEDEFPLTVRMTDGRFRFLAVGVRDKPAFVGDAEDEAAA